MPKGTQLKTITNKIFKNLSKKSAKSARSVLKRKGVRTPVIYAAIVLAILAPVIYLTLQKGNEAAAWWDETWQYRQIVTATVSSNASDITDLKTLVTINTSSLISSGKMQSDCDDMRFTSVNGAKLPYYLASGCNTTTTKVWILSDLVPKNTTTYELAFYYGHPTISSESDSDRFYDVYGLVGYWNMNESSWNGTAGEVKDSSGNAADGVRGGNATTTTGQYGSGGTFDGTGDYVSVADNSLYETSSTKTVSFWFNATSTSNGTLASKYQGDTNEDGWTIGVNSGTLNGWVKNSAGSVPASIPAGIAVSTSTWYHLAVTWDTGGGSITTYLNGALAGVSSATISGTFSGNTRGVSFARSLNSGSATSSEFTGLLDDMRIYNRVLSSTEVNRLYNEVGTSLGVASSTVIPSTAFGTEEIGKAPISYWKLDEGLGSTTYDAMGRNNATLGAGSSAPQWKSNSECISGTCLFFDNSNDYAEAADSDVLEILDGVDLTMSAWVRIPGLSDNNMIVAKKQGTTAGQQGYSMYVNSSGQVAVHISDDADQVHKFSSSTITANEWYYITAVFDEDSTITIYIDGVDAGGSVVGTIGNVGSLAGSAPLRFGTDSDGDLPFSGFIDEPKIYRYARTVDEIKTDYANGSSNQGSSVTSIAQNEGGSLTDGLAGYWKLDEIASGECVEIIDSITYIDDSCDASGNHHSGVWIANATAAQGKFGNGVSFDGVDDLISVPYSAALAPTGAISFGGWFETDDKTQDVRIISKTQSGGWNLGLNDTVASSLTGVVNVGGYHYVSYSNTNISNDTWYHAFVTYDGETVRLYLNGVEVDSNTDPSGSITYGASNTLCIGGEPDATVCTADNEFDGTLDEIRVYNRALNPAEVIQLYNFAPGPIAHYKLDEASGTSAIDSSGNANTGTLGVGSSAPQWTNGKFGNALSFDGSDDYVNIPYSSSLSLRNDVTFSAWVKRNSISQKSDILLKSDNSNYDFEFGIEPDGANADQLFVYGDAPGFFIVRSTGVINDTDWHHVAFTRRGSTTTFYIDGVTSGTSTVSGQFNDHSLPVRISSPFSGEFFSGNIDDVKIYNYARTSGQILQDLNVGHPNVGTPVGSTVLHLKMDEGYGTTTYDSSPQGNNGTLTNATWTNSGKFGRALSFNGTSAYVDLASTIQFDSGDFTISAWFKTSASGARRQIWNSGYNGGNTDVELLMDTTDEAYMYVRDSGGTSATVTSTNTLTDGSWHYVVGTRSSSTFKLYVDGKLNDTATASLGDVDTAGVTPRIGNGNGAINNRYFSGQLDEIKIYPFALTQEEINLDYNQGKLFAMGAGSTASDGVTPSNDADRSYCVPGDTTSCSAPIAEWKFDEATGTSAFDTSGGGNTGTLGGSGADPQWTTGKYGGALDFDGSDDYVSTAGTSVWDPTSAFTLSAWIYPRTFGEGGGGEIIGKVGRAHFYIDDDNDNLEYCDESTCTEARTSDNTIVTNTWQHVSAVYNGSGTMTMYVNGLDETSVSSVGETAGTGVTVIGADTAGSTTYTFDGLIDNVRIYNYARTPSQVAWEYNRGKPIAHYKFDECQGTTINDWGENANGGFNGGTGTLTIGGSGTQTSVGTCGSSGAWSNGSSGHNNSSMSFDGTDDYVSIADNDRFTFGDGTTDRPFSISTWVYAVDNTQGSLVAKYDETTGNQQREFQLYLSSSGYLTMLVEDETAGGYISRRWGTTVFPENEWHYVTATYDGSGVHTGIKLYVDGIQKDDTNTSSGSFTAIRNTTSPVEIGRNTSTSGGTDYPFDGQMDDVKIFNYELTADQIQTDMAGGAVSFR